jgi:hypothetical protein
VVTDPAGGAASETGDRERGRGQKRSGGRTGQTPEAKRHSPARDKSGGRRTTEIPKKSRFSYAEVAQDAVRMVIVNKTDESHITRKNFEEIQADMNRRFVDSLKKNEWVPEVDRWNYSSTYATMEFADDQSKAAVSQSVIEAGYKVVEMAVLREKRQPSKVLSGLIGGQTAKLSEEDLAVIVKSQVQKLGIVGRFEVMDSILTKNDNKILRIRVDEQAMEGFDRRGRVLRIAMAGRVLFADGREGMTLENKSRREIDATQEPLDVLESKILGEKARMATLQTQAKHQAESTSSVGSLGVNACLIISAGASKVVTLDEELNNLL